MGSQSDWVGVYGAMLLIITCLAGAVGVLSGIMALATGQMIGEKRVRRSPLLTLLLTPVVGYLLAWYASTNPGAPALRDFLIAVGIGAALQLPTVVYAARGARQGGSAFGQALKMAFLGPMACLGGSAAVLLGARFGWLELHGALAFVIPSLAAILWLWTLVRGVHGLVRTSSRRRAGS